MTVITTSNTGKAARNLLKIRLIKLQKLEEKNQISKEKKNLRSWEDKLEKESNKIRISEEELKIINAS